jgi:hypothetical protein
VCFCVCACACVACVCVEDTGGHMYRRMEMTGKSTNEH